MTFIDFSQVESLPEGVTAEALNDEGFQSLLKGRFDESHERFFETKAAGLKSNNAALKEEKDKYKGFLDEFKEQGVTLDEFKRLKDLAANQGDASQQLEIAATEKAAMKESFELKLSQRDDVVTSLERELDGERLSNRVSAGIRDHNAKYPSVALEDGTDRWVLEEARKVWKRDKDGNFIPMKGDTVMTGSDGNVMGYAEWVNDLRNEPAFAKLFKQPSGGGAGGDSGGKGGGHFNPKNLGGTPEERKAAIAAKLNL